MEQKTETQPNGSTGFDTFAAFADLEAVFKRDQAEAILSVMRGTNLQEDLATKGDLAKLNNDIKSNMASLELRLTNRIMGVVGGMLAIFTALEHFVLN